LRRREMSAVADVGIPSMTRTPVTQFRSRGYGAWLKPSSLQNSYKLWRNSFRSLTPSYTKSNSAVRLTVSNSLSLWANHASHRHGGFRHFHRRLFHSSMPPFSTCDETACSQLFIPLLAPPLPLHYAQSTLDPAIRRVSHISSRRRHPASTRRYTSAGGLVRYRFGHLQLRHFRLRL